MTHLCTCPGSLASTFEFDRKRDKGSEVSCKNCGGRFLVDGIAPLPANMLSTAGVEVTTAISSGVSWKTVTKGKRSRKPVARNLNGVMKLSNWSPKRVGDFSGSDSDKFGEATLEQRDADKVEHVPLKKRRHLIRSPSPSSQTCPLYMEPGSPQNISGSPHSEKIDQLSGCNRMKSHLTSCSSSSRKARRFDESAGFGNGNFYNPEDFSGIALLAAAACINIMEDDAEPTKEDLAVEEFSVSEGSKKSASAVALRENSTGMGSRDPLRQDVLNEDKMEQPFVMNNSDTVWGIRAENGQGRAERSMSSKVDRLHWDLNILMDAWEQPHDSVAEDALVGKSNADAQGEKSEEENCGMERDPKDTELDFGRYSPLQPNGAEGERLKSGIECKSELSEPNRRCTEKLPAHNLDLCSVIMLGSLNSDFADKKISSPSLRKDASLHDSGFDCSYNSSRISLSERNMAADSCSEYFLSNATVCSGSTLSGINDSKKFDFALPDLEALEKAACEKDILCRHAEYSTLISEAPNNRTLLRGTSDTLVVENSDSNFNEADDFHPSANCEDFYASGASTGEEQSIGDGDVRSQENRVSCAEILSSDSQLLFETKELISKHDGDYPSNRGAEGISLLQESCGSDDKGFTVDHPACSVKIGSILEDYHKSDVSQDNHGDMLGGKDATELQASYDSPVEDGELRVSILCSWEENGTEDGENECVDYESDGRNNGDSGAVDYHGSEIVEAGSEGSQGVEKRSSSTTEKPGSEFCKSGPVSFRRYFNTNSTEKIETDGKKGLDAGSGTTVQQSGHKNLEGNDDNMRRRCTSDHMNVIKGLYGEEIVSRATRGKLQSRIEGSGSLDIMDEKDTVFIHQSRLREFGGSCTHPEGDSNPNKFIGRYGTAFLVPERNGGDDQCGYWDSRNRCRSRYHGLEGHGQMRPRRITADSVDKFCGLDSRDQRQSVSYSSKNTHRPSVRRRSPIDRDDCDGIRRRMVPMRGISSNRSRDNSGAYSQGVGRGFREEYRHQMPNDTEGSSVRIPRYVSRRERSLSPSSNRPPQISLSRRRSRSRSRTRSPHVWHVQRERNLGTRRQSRSPDFRSDARIERVRIPSQKRSFAPDYGESFVSPPRDRLSPYRSCRWVDDKNFVDNHLRHRRSPLRMFRPNQRFESVGSAGRLTSDDYFRPVIRPGRFSLVGGSARGCKVGDNNYDDKGREERCEIMHRSRHSDGVNRRHFGHEAEDNFEAGNLQNGNDLRSTDQRDAPRTGREDKRSFKL